MTPATNPQQESVILALSDIHYGKRTADYNPDVAKQRLANFGEKVRRIRHNERNYRAFPELVVCLLGDVVDGAGIFKTQAHYQTITDPRQQASDLADLLAEWVRGMGKAFPSVRVEAVAGNHGRVGQFARDSASWDIDCYNQLRRELKGDGIKVNYPDTRPYPEGPDEDPFTKIIKVRKHKYLLAHGHGIRMYLRLPYYGITAAAIDWYMMFGGFDAAMTGHFHTAAKIYSQSIPVYLTGTPVTMDPFGIQAMRRKEINTWWMLGVSNNHSITDEWELSLV